MAVAAGADLLRPNGSHSPFLSMPADLAQAVIGIIRKES
jgi:hypothetical protein